jgi:hypothetical protein
MFNPGFNPKIKVGVCLLFALLHAKEIKKMLVFSAGA